MPRKINKRKAIQAKKREAEKKAKPRRVAMIAHYNNNMAAITSLLIAAKVVTDLGDDVLKGGDARINWRDDPNAVVEYDTPQTGRDYE